MADTSSRGKQATITILLIAALSTVALYLGLLTELEEKTWDWRLRWSASAKDHDPKIKLVMIDQTSLEHFAHHDKLFWTWPR